MDELLADGLSPESPFTLGRGTYGKVVLRGDLAVKLVGDAIETAIREIVFLRRCAHTNVVPLLDYAVTNTKGRPIIELTMPCFISLYDTWDDATAPSMRVIASQLCDIAAAVAYVHSVGVIHCDIKPQNVLVGEGRLMLCDFGISVDVAEPKHSKHVMSRGYRAPEISRSGGIYNELVDVWSLGVLMIEIIRGSRIQWQDIPDDSAKCAAVLFDVDDIHSLNEHDRLARISVLANDAATATHAIVSNALRPVGRSTAAEISSSLNRLFGRGGTILVVPTLVTATPPHRIADTDACGCRRCDRCCAASIVDVVVRDPLSRRLVWRLFEIKPVELRLLACCLVASSITRRAKKVVFEITFDDNIMTVCRDAMQLLHLLDNEKKQGRDLMRL